MRRAQRRSPILFAGLLLALWPRHTEIALAETPVGVNYRSFASYGGSPALPDEFSEVISSGTVSAIDFDWLDGPVLDSGLSDGVLIEFTGWLKAPTNDIYYLCGFTDDGFMLYLDGTLVINDWWDRGPQCGSVAEVSFQDGMSKELLAYYYENGGGAVASLWYWEPEGYWTPVTQSWYVNAGSPETTTTTTLPLETTTIPEETTTTWPEESTTTLPEETTTTSVETTIPVVETTEPWNPPPETEPKPRPEPTTTPETTTATTTPTETTTPEVTQPATSVQPEATVQPEPEPTSAPIETEPVPTEPPVTSEPEQTTPETSVVEPQEEPVDVLEPEPTNNIELISQLSDGELSELSLDKVEEILETIDYDELTEEETQQLISTLNESSDDVKSIFEETVNVYSGQFDSYIPSGSKITVGERRVLIAVTAVTVVAGAPAPAGRRSRK